MAEFEDHCRWHPMLAAHRPPAAYRFFESLPMTATRNKLELHHKVREETPPGTAERVLDQAAGN